MAYCIIGNSMRYKRYNWEVISWLLVIWICSMIMGVGFVGLVSAGNIFLSLITFIGCSVFVGCYAYKIHEETK